MKSTLLLMAALVAAPGLTLAQAVRPAAAVPQLHRLDPRTPQELREMFRPAAKPLPFVSAHRGGGRKGLPENCIATFEDTLRHTPAMMEIDPRFTKDGAIVVHHDPTLERTTTGTGKVADFTLAELKQLRLKDPDGRVTDFRIPTLDEVLDWARGRTIVVLDQKDVPVATRVGKITEHHAEAFAMVIVNSFKDAQACHALNPEVMMEVMIPSRRKAEEFGTLGIPWNHVVAFVGHEPPEDAALYEFIRRQGASCMIGTSRNLDLRVITGKVPDIKVLEPDYRAFLRRGAGLIETDIPTLLGPLLHSSLPVPGAK
jgi:glycerophosphoryl diester phosphodiesterase